jgi:DNA-binding MarR family transcriptional regulator
MPDAPATPLAAPPATPPGPALALLLLGGWRRLVDEAVEELDARGFGDVRPTHDFAMRAIESGADSASELGRRMSITKQAASKVIDTLMERGWVDREPDPEDGRRKRLTVTEAGREVMAEGERVFNGLRSRLQDRVGADRLRDLEETLALLVGDDPVRLDAPGWVASE